MVGKRFLLLEGEVNVSFSFIFFIFHALLDDAGQMWIDLPRLVDVLSCWLLAMCTGRLTVDAIFDGRRSIDWVLAKDAATLSSFSRTNEAVARSWSSFFSMDFFPIFQLFGARCRKYSDLNLELIKCEKLQNLISLRCSRCLFVNCVCFFQLKIQKEV